jgi:hypothetical protein
MRAALKLLTELLAARRQEICRPGAPGKLRLVSAVTVAVASCLIRPCA